jgi:serine/threonine-protein kinase
MEDWQGYRLVARVAEQRHSRVWKARDDSLHRDVAIKELLATDEHELIGQWKREATVLAALDHPNIVAVYEFQQTAGRAAIVEEWVDGATLSAVIRHHGRLTAPQALSVTRGALSGLAYAHDKGVVHGDVSDSNIMVATDGDSRLIDFGLASRGGPGSGSSGGTAAFQAPEVSSGAPVRQSDVYSAAAVLASMLRGARSEIPTTDGVTEPVKTVLDTALDPDPARRYPDAAAFLAALEEAARSSYGTAWWSQAGLGAAAGGAMSGLVAVTAGGAGGTGPQPIQVGGGDAASSVPGAAVTRAARTGGRHGALIAGGAVAALLVVGGAAYAVHQRSTSPSGRVDAAGTSVPGGAATPAGLVTTSSTTTAAPTRPATWPGAYRTKLVLSKVTGGFFDASTLKVGQTTRAQWMLSSACSAGPCDLHVTSPTGTRLTLSYAAGAWTIRETGTVRCGVAGQGLGKGTSTYTDRLVVKAGAWSDVTPPTLTGTETVVYGPCTGGTGTSSLTYRVTIAPA